MFYCQIYLFLLFIYSYNPDKKGMMSVQQSPAAVTSSSGGRKIKTKKTADKIKGIYNLSIIKQKVQKINKVVYENLLLWPFTSIFITYMYNLILIKFWDHVKKTK